MKIEKIVLAEGEKKPECCGKCSFGIDLSINNASRKFIKCDLFCNVLEWAVNRYASPTNCPIVEFNETLTDH